MKKIITLLFALILFFLSAGQTFASDLTVTCADNGPCGMTPTEGASLFNEDKWLPSQSITRSITVVNNDTDDNCSLYFDTINEQDPDNFSSVIFTVIKDGEVDLFGRRDGENRASSKKSLKDLFDEGDIFLTTIPFSSSKTLTWTVTFDPLAGNIYQGKQVVFDFDFHFSCDTAPTPTPTITPTVSSNSNSNSNSGNSDNSSNSNNSNSGGGGTTNTTTPPTVPLVAGFIPLAFNPLAGYTQDVPLEIIPPGQVLGITDQASPFVTSGLSCRNPWWWYLLLLFQGLGSALIHRKTKKENTSINLTLQAFITTVCMYLFATYFCWWWLIIACGIVGITAVILTYVKVSETEKNYAAFRDWQTYHLEL